MSYTIPVLSRRRFVSKAGLLEHCSAVPLALQGWLLNAYHTAGRWESFFQGLEGSRTWPQNLCNLPHSLCRRWKRRSSFSQAGKGDMKREGKLSPCMEWSNASVHQTGFWQGRIFSEASVFKHFPYLQVYHNNTCLREKLDEAVWHFQWTVLEISSAAVPPRFACPGLLKGVAASPLQACTESLQAFASSSVTCC